MVQMLGSTPTFNAYSHCSTAHPSAFAVLICVQYVLLMHVRCGVCRVIRLHCCTLV